MNNDEIESLISIFSYLGGVHEQQEDVLQRISAIYSETLYVESMKDIREAVEIYLNCLTQMRRANLNLMAVYSNVVDKLTE